MNLVDVRPGCWNHGVEIYYLAQLEIDGIRDAPARDIARTIITVGRRPEDYRSGRYIGRVDEDRNGRIGRAFSRRALGGPGPTLVRAVHEERSGWTRIDRVVTLGAIHAHAGALFHDVHVDVVSIAFNDEGPIAELVTRTVCGAVRALVLTGPGGDARARVANLSACAGAVRLPSVGCSAHQHELLVVAGTSQRSGARASIPERADLPAGSGSSPSADGRRSRTAA